MEWEPLFNAAGVPVGSYAMKPSHKVITKKDREFCSALVDRLISEKRRRDESMERATRKRSEPAKGSENGKGSEGKIFTSECYVGGTIQKGAVEDTGGYCLVKVADNSGFIFCDVYQSEELARRLEKYDVGDHILIKGFIRVWSQKKDDGFVNRTSVRITEIRSKDPEPKAGGAVPSGYHDDDVPF